MSGDTAAETDPDALFDEEFQRRLEVLALVSRRVYAGRNRADRRSKKVGSGIEFADHREYAAGDDFRAIDWNVYQRTGRLLVRLFEEEEDLKVHLLIDTSRSMQASQKLDYAKRVAAALAYVALANLDRVSLNTLDTAVRESLPATRGKRRIFRVFSFLAPLRAEQTTDLAAAARAFVARQRRRGVAILLSDLYDPHGVEGALDVLRHAGFELKVLHIVDRREADPPLHGDLRLVDAETGRTRDVTLTPRLLLLYRELYEKRLEQLRATCRDKQVVYQHLDVSTPFDEAVLSVLRRGGVLG